MVERSLSMREVAGSIPAFSTNNSFFKSIQSKFGHFLDLIALVEKFRFFQKVYVI
jgi:hypothetical protein